MSYYDTNTEIANTFNVSKTTVSRWLEGASDGRNNLLIDKRDKKVYVLKNEHNYAEMLKLKEEGLKYKGSSSYVEVSPKKEFYEIFNDYQIIDIVNCLDLRKEISHKYSYFNGGANFWDNLYTTSVESGTYLTPFRVMNLLEHNFDYINYQTSNYDKINVFEVGPGNGKPAKLFLNKLLKLGKLNSYTAVDISLEMCKIAEKNISEWFPSISINHYLCDIENADLSKILFENKHSDNNESVVNVIMYLGSTIGIHWDVYTVLKNLSNSMDKEDILVISNTLNTTRNRSEVSFAKTEDAVLQNSWVAKSLGIDVDRCEFEARYDYEGNWKVLYFRLDKDYCISFNLLGRVKKVFLRKGEEVTVWRHKMSTFTSLSNELERANLQPVQISAEKDLSHVLVICQAANK